MKKRFLSMAAVALALSISTGRTALQVPGNPMRMVNITRTMTVPARYMLAGSPIRKTERCITWTRMVMQ